MKIIDWLLEGDPSIAKMVKEDLFLEDTPYQNKKYIEDYLAHFDSKTRFFGGGLYSPKWISTFYTTLELANLRIDPNNEIYLASCQHLYQNIWKNNTLFKEQTKRDVCIIGMLLKMLAYQGTKESDLKEIIDFLIDSQMHDGGWNCRYNKYPKPHTSSLHTTISVLEGIEIYLRNGYQYKGNQLKEIREKSHEFMLLKQLFRSRRTKKIIHKEMVKFHYPNRWKYDCFRALDYFQRISYPYDARMEEALINVRKQIQKGYIHRGKQYNGKTFFHLEKGQRGRFTTLQALKILQCYDPIFYQFITTKDFSYA